MGLPFLLLKTISRAEKIKDFVRCFHSWKFIEFQIPRVYWDLTTSRVLTMEFEEGAKVTDLAYLNEKKIDPMCLSSRLGELYSHMIFKHGFVHSDPHPGNILINQNDKNKLNIILLDHGLYAVSFWRIL